MKKNSSLSLITTFTLSFFILTSAPAYAYLDPGTGSVILQGIVGAFAAAAVVLRVYWHRVLRFFGLRKDLDEQETPPNIES